MLLARNAERLQVTLDSLEGEGHASYVFDLTAVHEIPALMKKISQEHGPLSGFFHSAGVGGIKVINILKRKGY